MSEIGRTKKESQRYTRATTSKPKHMVSICPLMLPQKHVDTTCGESTRKGCDAILCCYYYLHKTTERPAVLDLHTHTDTHHTHIHTQCILFNSSESLMSWRVKSPLHIFCSRGPITSMLILAGVIPLPRAQ